MYRKTILISLIALTPCSLLAVLPQDSAEAAADLLQGFYFAHDWEQGFVRGGELVQQFPASSRLRAWWLLNMARNSDVEEAVQQAEAMTRQDGEDPWSWLGLAGTLIFDSQRREEALEASRKLLEAAPEMAEAVWMRAAVLANQEDPAATLPFVDSWLKQADPWAARLLVLKGVALNVQSRRNKDLFEESLDVLSQARKLDEANLDSYYLAGVYLADRDRYAEALPLLERAVEISPNSIDALSRFWQISRRLGASEAEIKKSIDAFLERRTEYPEAHFMAYVGCRSMGFEEREKRLGDTILQKFPASAGAEWVLVNRYRDFSKKMSSEGLSQDENASHEFRSMLREFIQRPRHIRESLLGDAYRSLFESLAADPQAAPEELLEAVEGMVRYEDSNPHIVYAEAPIALAEKTPYLKEAEKIARAGLEASRKKLEEERRFYQTDQDYRDARKRVESTIRDGLGWVLVQAGRLKDAEKELTLASQLNPRNIDNRYHLGRFYEAQGRPEEAEKHFIRGLSIGSLGDNPSEKAIRSLYLNRRGSLEGFEDYRANLEEIDRRNRKQEVLASKIDQPVPAPAFRLKAMDGSTLSSGDLKGKVAVVNFWGIWCSWCVRELPEFQQLHEKYRQDPEVQVLSINYNDVAQDVPPWMEEKGFDFLVLLDDGWVKRAGVESFPTTWFLNPRGEMAFEKEGWSEKLLEEFSWRIEALRER